MTPVNAPMPVYTITRIGNGIESRSHSLPSLALRFIGVGFGVGIGVGIAGGLSMREGGDMIAPLCGLGVGVCVGVEDALT